MSAEWLEKQVERRLEAVQLQRLDAYLGGDIAAEKCDREVVRQDVRNTVESDLQMSLSDAQQELMKKFFERTRFDVAQESANTQREQAIKQWNEMWFRSYTSTGRLPPSLSRFSFARLDLSGINLSNADLSHLEGYLSDHNNVDLSNAYLSWSDFAYTNLAQACLRDANLDHAFLVRVAGKMM